MCTRKPWIVLTVLISLLLAACVSSSSSIEVPTATSIITLKETGWLLESLRGQPVLPGTQLTINFENDKFHGRDGCNLFNGMYTVDRDRVDIEKDIATSMMSCEEPIMQQASAYLDALILAKTFEVSGQGLILRDSQEKILAEFIPQSRELGGTSWVVTGYNNGKQAVVSVITGSSLTANFGADGMLTGSTGCNNYTASYQVIGDTLRVGPSATTRKMCAEPAGVMDQEALFLKALEMVSTYSIDGDKLEMRTSDNALAVACLRSSPAEENSSTEVVMTPTLASHEVKPSASDPTEAIEAIRNLLGLPDLPLEFTEVTYMANSPKGSLQVEAYRDSEGRIYSVNPETNQVVEIDARAILASIPADAPALSIDEIEAKAIVAARAVLPDFDSLQPSLQYEPGGKVDNFFFTWYREMSPGASSRPFLQVAFHKSGVLFAFYNTLSVEE